MAPTLGEFTPAVAAGSGATATGASRLSKLTRGTRLVHADLHNHSLLSDGDGDPAEAFASMRSAGLSSGHGRHMASNALLNWSRRNAKSAPRRTSAFWSGVRCLNP